MLCKIVIASLLGWMALANAQTPSSSAPLKLIVPFPPGDGLESAARVLGELVAKDLDTVVVIDNKVGASGAVAA